MKFIPSKLSGAYVVEMEKRQDERGFLARTWCREEFAKNGIDFDPAQAYTSSTVSKGTMRGIHYNIPPVKQKQFTRCIRGKIFEVIIDLRPESPTFMQWEGFTMSAEDYKLLYMPENFAHGFLTLTDDVEFFNLYTPAYEGSTERGIRFDDPAFNIEWPEKVINVSDKDKSWPDFKE